MRNRKGSVIVYVLFMVSVISVVAFVSIRSVKSLYLESSLIPYRHSLALELKPIAMIGIKRFTSEMTVAKFRRSYGFNKLKRVYELETGSKSYRVVVEPEVGRISVNLADRGTFERLFKKVLEDKNYKFKKEDIDNLVDAMLDFRDRDDERRPYGAEREYYTSVGYQPKNAFLSSLSELLWVRGISEEIYGEMLKYLTVLNQPINVNYTTKEILMLAGLSESEANMLISLQKIKGLDSISTKEFYGALTPYHRELFKHRFVLHPMPDTFRVRVYEIKRPKQEVSLVLDVYGNLYDVLW